MRYVLRRKVGHENSRSFLDSQDGILLYRCVGREHRFRQTDCQRTREEVVLYSEGEVIVLVFGLQRHPLILMPSQHAHIWVQGEGMIRLHRR